MGGGNIGSAGLSAAEVEARRAQYGPNRLPEPPLPGVFALFARQFLSPFIYILVAAAVVSFALAKISSGVFIVIVLLINAAIGTIQEHSAQKAAAALRHMVRGSARVIRDGKAQSIDIEELVPGDLVLLGSGDRVPADIALRAAQDLAVDESMLSGESLAVEKDPHADASSDAPLSDQRNRCFAGTIVTRGRGQGTVSAIGSGTEIGRIAERVTEDRTAEPPLLIRIRNFTYQIAGAIGVAIVALAGLMLLQGGYTFEAILLMSIGLAVSTIPEGLPAALTVALAIGMRRMARHNVIIRKLIAVEALGSCTFICSDKTGTLTVNELTIRKVMLPDGTAHEVSGEGVAPGGAIHGADPDGPVAELCVAGILANESRLDYVGGDWAAEGDIVDVAFLVLAKKLGLSISAIRNANEIAELIPYESERAFAGSLSREGEEHVLFVKGSPERILAMCSRMLIDGEAVDIDRGTVQQHYEALAGQGYRLIALARRSVAGGAGAEESLNDMTYLGLVAMIDPVRPEARDAVARCRHGGIEVAMVTGDHPLTARAIAVELGLCDADAAVVTGSDLRDATARGQSEADALIADARVFARIEPQQKEQIVESFQRAGHFVAVTGDGVNDAPAMRGANVGIAMGKRGTDVARETADLIITDDNFASIVDGIEQGRVVYNNIRKVIGLLIATGFSAILLFFFSVLAGLPMPLVAVQLLWLNLIANGVQDVALAFEPKEGGELDQKPRRPDEPIFEGRIIEKVLVTGGVMGLMGFATFWWLNQAGYAVEEARNLTLMLMVLFGNIRVLNARSETQSVFRMSLRSNLFVMLAVPLAQLVHIGAMYTPVLSDVLEIRPISLLEWLALLGVASTLLVVEEIQKAIRRRRG